METKVLSKRKEKKKKIWGRAAFRKFELTAGQRQMGGICWAISSGSFCLIITFFNDLSNKLQKCGCILQKVTTGYTEILSSQSCRTPRTAPQELQKSNQKCNPNAGACNEAPAGIFRISAGSRARSQGLLWFWSDLDQPLVFLPPQHNSFASLLLPKFSEGPLWWTWGALSCSQTIINNKETQILVEQNDQASAGITISKLPGESLLEKQLDNNKPVPESSKTFHAGLEKSRPKNEWNWIGLNKRNVPTSSPAPTWNWSFTELWKSNHSVLFQNFLHSSQILE